MSISKNGKTKHIQRLVKILRKNKTYGGDWFSSSKPTNVVGNNLEKIQTAKNINKTLQIASVVAGTAVALELVSHAAEPLLAASGVGIPLLAILIIAKKLAKQYKQNLQLQSVLSDVLIIISNSFYLVALIKKTMAEFSQPVQEALTIEARINNNVNSAENPTNIIPEQSGTTQQLVDVVVANEVSNEITPTNQNNTRFAKINNDIEERIKNKLDELNRLLQKISPDDNDTRFGSIQKKFKRFFFSGELKNEIITNLSIINGLFTIYNSQFDWSIRYYESKILSYSDNGKEQIQNIWKNIEGSTEYEKYLFPKDENVDELIKNAGTKPDVIENVEKEIAINNPEINGSSTIPPSNIPQSNIPPSNIPQSNIPPSTVQPSNIQPSTVQPSNIPQSTVQPSNIQPSNNQPNKKSFFNWFGGRKTQKRRSKERRYKKYSTSKRKYNINSYYLFSR